LAFREGNSGIWIKPSPAWDICWLKGGLVKRVQFVLIVILPAVLAGCGGSGGVSPSKGQTPSGGGAPVGPPVLVSLSSGLPVSGVNIAVPTPAASPAPNAQLLGVGPVTGGTISAFNTGAQIQRNTTMQVILFGPGLSGSMQVSINGPADIAISNVQSITATDGTPGVSFVAAVSGTAALGARSVVLQNTQNDITTFTGGLEVVP